MTPEFYSDEDLAKSRQLYHQVRAWGVKRGDVNLIGGWAVKELVGTFAFESRDLDLILQTNAAFESFEQHLAEWDLTWRRKGRTVFKECHFRNGPAYPPLVDVFTTDPSIGFHRFTTLAASNVKPPMGPTWLPSLEAILADKIQTVPLREAAADKYAKDLLDIWLLITHNRDGKTPSELLNVARPEDRARAAKRAADSIEAFPQFRDRFADVERWLRARA